MSSERPGVGTVVGSILTAGFTAGALMYLVRSEEVGSVEPPTATPTVTPEVLVINPPIVDPRIINCEFDEGQFRYVELTEGKVNDLGIPTPTCLEWPTDIIQPILPPATFGQGYMGPRGVHFKE